MTEILATVLYNIPELDTVAIEAGTALGSKTIEHVPSATALHDLDTEVDVTNATIMDHSEEYKVNQKHYLKLAGLDKQHKTGEEQTAAFVLAIEHALVLDNKVGDDIASGNLGNIETPVTDIAENHEEVITDQETGEEHALVLDNRVGEVETSGSC